MRRLKTKGMYLLAVVVMAAMLLTLTACGGDSAPEEVAPTPTPTATPTPEPTPEPTPQADAEPVYDTEGYGDSLEAGTLAGLWEWEDDFTFRYTFNEDGTGVRGFGAALTVFEWYADYEMGYLDIYVPSVLEEWSYLIYDGVLVIESLQVPGLTFAYVWMDYIEDDSDFDLAGVWSWVDDAGNIAAFDYVFFADGSGLRGSEVLFDVFYWEADDGVLLIYIPGMVEEWDFELSGDTVTISSNELPGVRLVYNRIQ